MHNAEGTTCYDVFLTIEKYVFCSIGTIIRRKKKSKVEVKLLLLFFFGGGGIYQIKTFFTLTLPMQSINKAIVFICLGPGLLLYKICNGTKKTKQKNNRLKSDVCRKYRHGID